MVKKLITIFTMVYFLVGCCEDATFSRNLFEIQYNDTYQGQFDIEGIYLSEDRTSINILIIYSNGIMYFPSVNDYKDDYHRLRENKPSNCGLVLNGYTPDYFSWCFYRVSEDSNDTFIEFEILQPRSYCSESFKTKQFRIDIINDTTLRFSNNNYNLVKCNNKPEYIDYWRDR